MTLLEVMGSLFLLLTTSLTYGWFWTHELAQVGREQIQFSLDTCLDSAAEALAAASVPENLTLNGMVCNVQTSQKMQDGVGWLVLRARIQDQSGELWYRTN